jgi:hypothetical protein
VPLPAPTDGEVARLLATVRRRIVRHVARHGIDLENPSGETQPTDERLFDCPVYAEIQGAAVVGRSRHPTAGWSAGAACGAQPFAIDILACPNCGARLRLISTITHSSVIEKIPHHLGLPTETALPMPAKVLGWLPGVEPAADWITE